MMSEGLFFPQTSGSTATSGTVYVNDSFKDYVKPATNNTSLTSTVSTNPLNDYFGNTGVPKYSIKTLYIKDLIVEDDTSKWVQGGRTYRVQFTENFPGISGYVVGAPNLSSQVNGKVVSLNRSGDGFGVSGNILKAYFLVKPKAGIPSGVVTTYSYVVDNGVPVAITPSLFSDEAGGISAATAAGTNYINDQFKYFFIDDATGLQSNDLHDFRVMVTSSSVGDWLEVVGVVVVLSTDQSNVLIRPSSAFVDKQLTTTNAVSTVALPAQNASLFHLGAKSTFFENQAGSRGVTTYQVPLLQSQATGLSGTNSVAALTGTGASFPIGTGINIQAGSSHYYGKVTAQSTDTLTVSPTLAFGVSGATMTKAFFVPDITNYKTNSLDSSIYELAYSWDPVTTYGVSNIIDAKYYSGGVTNIPGGFSFTPYQPYYDAENRFGVFPITTPGATATQGRMSFVMNSLSNDQQAMGWMGPLAVKGDFQAIEFEFITPTTGAATFIIGASCSIDGVFLTPPGATNIAIGQTLPQRFKMLFAKDLGIGWHSMQYFANVTAQEATAHPIIKKVNFYKYKGVSIAGQIATIEQNQTQFAITGQSLATPIGLHKFFGADKLTYTGAWFKQGFGPAASLSITPGFARVIAGATSGVAMTFKYFGDNFVPYFDSAGGSFSVTLDGVATGGLTSGAIFGVATEMLHTLVFTRESGTFAIQGIGITKDYGELKYKQNFAPIPELFDIDGFYLQDKTVSVRKSRRRFIGATTGIGGLALQPALISKLFSGTLTPEFIQSVALETTGNPVFLGLISNGGIATLSFGYATPMMSVALNASLGGGINLYIARVPYNVTNFLKADPTIGNGVTGVIYYSNNSYAVGSTTGNEVHIAPDAVKTIDIPPAGRWTYNLYGTGGPGPSCLIMNCRLFAMEMF